MKKLRFKKVRRCYHPNGDEWEGNYLSFLTIKTIVCLIEWIVYPLIYFSDSKKSGKSIVYWEEVK